jgi:hypothetical protein
MIKKAVTVGLGIVLLYFLAGWAWAAWHMQSCAVDTVTKTVECQPVAWWVRFLVVSIIPPFFTMWILIFLLLKLIL